MPHHYPTPDEWSRRNLRVFVSTCMSMGRTLALKARLLCCLDWANTIKSTYGLFRTTHTHIYIFKNQRDPHVRRWSCMMIMQIWLLPTNTYKHMGLPVEIPKNRDGSRQTESAEALIQYIAQQLPWDSTYLYIPVIFSKNLPVDRTFERHQKGCFSRNHKVSFLRYFFQWSCEPLLCPSSNKLEEQERRDKDRSQNRPRCIYSKAHVLMFYLDSGLPCILIRRIY